MRDILIATENSLKLLRINQRAAATANANAADAAGQRTNILSLCLSLSPSFIVFTHKREWKWKSDLTMTPYFSHHNEGQLITCILLNLSINTREKLQINCTCGDCCPDWHLL